LVKKMNQKGFTLVEAGVALAIAGILSVIVLNHRVSMEAKAKLYMIEVRVTQLQSSLNSFIQTNCKRNTHIQPTLQVLENERLIANVDIFTSPYTQTPFDVEVSWVMPFTQKIKVDIGDADIANKIMQAVSADAVENNKLVFEKRLSYMAEHDVEGSKNYRMMFEQECTQ
jgi:prepilin-type N-terminal cleavage/methylation domain-containing protein